MNDLKRFQKWAIGLTGVAILVATIVSGVAGANQWQPREGCGYRIVPGDTLTRIANAHGVTVTTLVAVNPSITDPDRIQAGDHIDICKTGADARPTLVEPESAATVTPLMIEWAEALIATMPAESDITSADLRFLMAISGPESAWCTNTWNPGDAGAGGFFGSYGCIQVRVTTQWESRGEPFRNLDWLKESRLHEAEAAWFLYTVSWGGTDMWGPARPTKEGTVPPKMPPGGPEACEWSSNMSRCLNYWAIADAVLAEVKGVE